MSLFPFPFPFPFLALEPLVGSQLFPGNLSIALEIRPAQCPALVWYPWAAPVLASCWDRPEQIADRATWGPSSHLSGLVQRGPGHPIDIFSLGLFSSSASPAPLQHTFRCCLSAMVRLPLPQRLSSHLSVRSTSSTPGQSRSTSPMRPVEPKPLLLKVSVIKVSEPTLRPLRPPPPPPGPRRLIGASCFA